MNALVNFLPYAKESYGYVKLSNSHINTKAEFLKNMLESPIEYKENINSNDSFVYDGLLDIRIGKEHVRDGKTALVFEPDKPLDLSNFSSAKIFENKYSIGDNIIVGAKNINYIETGSGNDHITIPETSTFSKIVDYSGNDTYIINGNAIIKDYDGRGVIYFKGYNLSGKYKLKGDNLFTYSHPITAKLDKNDNVVFSYDDNILKIENGFFFSNNHLGMSISHQFDWVV